MYLVFLIPACLHGLISSKNYDLILQEGGPKPPSVCILFYCAGYYASDDLLLEYQIQDQDGQYT